MATQRIERTPTVEERLRNCEALFSLAIEKAGGTITFSSLEIALRIMHPKELSLVIKPSTGEFVATNLIAGEKS